MAQKANQVLSLLAKEYFILVKLVDSLEGKHLYFTRHEYADTIKETIELIYLFPTSVIIIVTGIISEEKKTLRAVYDNLKNQTGS